MQAILSLYEVNFDLKLKFNLKENCPYQELNEIHNAVQSIEKEAIFEESVIQYAHFWKSYYHPDFLYP